jgi:hypothetical protein
MEQESEQPLIDPPVRPKRKYIRRKYIKRGQYTAPSVERAPMPALNTASDDELFFGLSTNSCSFKCDEAAARGEPCCVITGQNRCGNPLTAGLQAMDRVNPRVLNLYNRAIRWLKMQAAAKKPV